MELAFLLLRQPALIVFQNARSSTFGAVVVGALAACGGASALDVPDPAPPELEASTPPGPTSTTTPPTPPGPIDASILPVPDAALDAPADALPDAPVDAAPDAPVVVPDTVASIVAGGSRTCAVYGPSGR